MTVDPLRAQPRDVAHPRAISPRIHRHRRRLTARALLACAAAAAVAASARADGYWVGVNGNWDDPLWSATEGGPPGAPSPSFSQAFLTYDDAVSRTVTYAHPDTDPTVLWGLYVDNTGGGASILSQTQGSMHLLAGFIIGAAGRGEYDLGGGTLVSDNSVPATLGRDVSGDGAMRVSGVAAGVTFYHGALIGDLGHGSVVQTSGTVTITDRFPLVLGNRAGGVGSYSLSGNGTLNSNGPLYVGYGGTGSYEQNGGTATVNQMILSGTPRSPASTGSALLSGGQLAVSDALTVNSGNFAQFGGNATIGGTMTVGTDSTAGAAGTVLLTGGSLSAGALNLVNGNVFQNAGAATTFGSVTVGTTGFGTLASAAYSLGNGAALTVNGGLTVVGGSFNQNGGSVRAPSVSVDGRYFTVPASYSIGPGGTLDVAGPILLAAASYTQTGGAVTATKFTDAATIYPNYPSSITLSGGTLLAPGTSSFLDYNSASTMVQTGGTFHVGTFAIPSYSLSGNGVLIVDGDMNGAPWPSFAAKTSLTQHSGATTIGGQLYLTDNSSVSGGTLAVGGTMRSIPQRGLEDVAPTFTQSGGTIRAAAFQICGSRAGDAISTYVLSDGTLTATNGTSYVGNSDLPGSSIKSYGPAAFVQTGGTLTASELHVTDPITGSSRPSSYTLAGGQLNVTGDLQVSDIAYYTQTAGTATIGGTLHTFYDPYRVAIPSNSLTGGTLNAAALLNEGSFVYSGGTLNAPVVNQTSDLGPAVFTLNGIVETVPSLLNTGTVRTENTWARFTGGATNNAAYLSSYGSYNDFVTLTNGPTAYLQGGASDRFRFTGDLLSASTNAANWQTTAAAMEFQSSGSSNAHTLSVTGLDEGGGNLNGYVNNFAWGALQLDAGQSLTLQDGNATPGGALYVGAVALADGLPQIGDITGNGLNIYYDATNPANAYLGGQTYPLVNGGFLIGDAAGTGAVPEPGAWGGMLMAGAAAGLRRRRRRGG